MNSSDSSLPQRTGLLDLNKSLFCRRLGHGELYHKEMMVDGHLVLVVDWLYDIGVGA
jgi:hypothetical protein